MRNNSLREGLDLMRGNMFSAIEWSITGHEYCITSFTCNSDNSFKKTSHRHWNWKRSNIKLYI